jgi:hypothetical protein
MFCDGFTEVKMENSNSDASTLPNHINIHYVKTKKLLVGRIFSSL